MTNDNDTHDGTQDDTDEMEDTNGRPAEDKGDNDGYQSDDERDGNVEAHDDETDTAQSDATATTDDATETSTYQFDRFGRSMLPPNIQYTPEFDDDWIYPTGTKDGATRDDVPVQGLELGIVAGPDELRTTIEGVLLALKSYHDETGVYPRHRIVASKESFHTVDGVGLVAAFQPRPNEDDGLIAHMNALETDPDALTPNRKRAQLLVTHLYQGLAVQDGVSFDGSLGHGAVSSVWPTARQIGETPIIERYAPLAAGDLYDPTEGEVGLDGPGLDDVSALSFDPDYLNVSSVDELPTTDGDTASEADDPSPDGTTTADDATDSDGAEGQKDESATGAEADHAESDTDEKTDTDETGSDDGTVPH